MKRLLLLRHAKSSWSEPNLADFDRPLNERGIEETQIIGGRIRENGIDVSLIISSPAKRAVDTAVRIRDISGLNAEITCDEQIYEASPLTLMRVVSNLSPDFESVLLIGHNPGLEGFIRLVTGTIHPMSTASLADITFEIEEWCQISAGGGKLNGIFRPPA